MIAIGFALTGSPDGHPPVADQPVVEPLPMIRNAQWTQLSEREWFYIDGLAWRLGNPPGTREWTGIRDVLSKDAVDSARHRVRSRPTGCKRVR